MGNQQSNENTKKSRIITRTVKKEDREIVRCGIIKREEFSNFIRLHVDKYIFYKDKNQKHIDLANSTPYNDIEYSFLLDFAYTIKHSHTKTFGVGEIWDLVGEKKVEEEAWEDSAGNFRNSDGNIISDTLKLVTGVGEIIEENQKYAAWVEYDRYANNHAWTKQTSWDMPPGWK